MPRWKKLKKDGLCGQCKTDMRGWTIEQKLQHFVEAHGFIREGNNVFQRKFCYCGKPGFYHVGAAFYCKQHVGEAQTRRNAVARAYLEPVAARLERMRKDFNIARESKAKLGKLHAQGSVSRHLK